MTKPNFKKPQLTPAGQQRRTATFASLSALALSGCGGGRDTSVQLTSASPANIAALPAVTPPVAPIAARFAYVTNAGDDAVSIYKVDDATGDLWPLGYARTGGYPSAVQVDPRGWFAYVTDSRTGGLAAYRIDRTSGLLTLLNTIVGTSLNSIVSWPYPVDAQTIDGYRSALVNLNLAGTVAVHPNNKFIFVANKYADSVSTYLNASGFDVDSPVALVGTASTGSRPDTVAVHPSGKFVYVTNSLANSVSSYTVNQTTGLLTQLATGFSPLFTETRPCCVALDASGKYAYVANFDSSSITPFSIDPASGVLTIIAPGGRGGSSFAGPQPKAVTVHPSGKFAYAINFGASTARAHTVNTSGELVAIATGSTVATALNPTAIKIEPTGKWAYITSYESNNITVHDVDLSTGALSAARPNTSTTWRRPTSIAFAAPQDGPRLYVAYVANAGSSTVSMYRLEPYSGYGIAAGTLTPIGTPTNTIATNPNPAVVVVDPKGKAVFTDNANNGAANMSMFTVNQYSGMLTANGTQSSATRTNADNDGFVIDPGGQFAYAKSWLFCKVSRYAISSTSSQLTWMGDTSMIDPPNSFTSAAPSYRNPKVLAVHPSGKFLFVADDPIANQVGFTPTRGVRVYEVNSGNGELYGINVPLSNLSTASGFPTYDLGFNTTLGAVPTSIKVHPSGRFLYVACNGFAITNYTINQFSGALTFVSLNNTPSAAKYFNIHPNGNFAYALNGNNQLLSYSINQSNGSLTYLSSIQSPGGLTQLAIEPTGKFAYAINGSQAIVKVFSIDPLTGVIAALTNLNVSTGSQPSSIAIGLGGPHDLS